MIKDIDKLIGLYAYDTGCNDSGIHDELLRNKLKTKLKNDPNIYKTLGIFLREAFLTDSALAKGHSLEDVIAFVNWLDEYMQIEL